MEHEVLLDKVKEIVDAQSVRDKHLREAWTGDVGAISSVEVKTIRIL